MKVSGSVAIVTGGASGIGKAISWKLLENGAKVSILDVQQEAASSTVAEFSSIFSSDHVMFVHCDITKRESLEAAFDQTISKFGQLNIVCNNAGVVLERDPEKTIQVNLLGTMYGVELAIQHMGRQHGGQGGVVVNTASDAGIYGLPFMPVYSTSKAAVCMYTKCMAARQLSEQGVRISALCPSAVDTKLQDAIARESVVNEEQMRAELDKYVKIIPEEVADAAYHLITDDSKIGTLLKVNPFGRQEHQLPEPVFKMKDDK